MTLPFSSAYSFDDTEDQLDTLNKLILTAIDKHGPIVRTKFTGPPPPFMKGVEHLPCKRDHWRHNTHKYPTNENFQNFKDIGNKINKPSEKKQLSFTETYYPRKTVKSYRKSYITS